MTATNIDIAEFINVLSRIHASGVNLINLDMLPDESRPEMNRLVIHPIADQGSFNSNGNNKSYGRFTVRNPNISTENNDIFNALNDF